MGCVVYCVFTLRALQPFPLCFFSPTPYRKHPRPPPPHITLPPLPPSVIHSQLQDFLHKTRTIALHWEWEYQPDYCSTIMDYIPLKPNPYRLPRTIGLACRARCKRVWGGELGHIDVANARAVAFLCGPDTEQ